MKAEKDGFSPSFFAFVYGIALQIERVRATVNVLRPYDGSVCGFDCFEKSKVFQRGIHFHFQQRPCVENSLLTVLKGEQEFKIIVRNHGGYSRTEGAPLIVSHMFITYKIGTLFLYRCSGEISISPSFHIGIP